MKKFLKNSVLAMLVICFVLNGLNAINLGVEYHKITMHHEEVAQIVANQSSSSEEIYQALASFYWIGYGNKIEIQLGIIGLSILFGAVIGLMVTFEKKSKIKFVLNYVLGVLMISTVMTLFYISQDMNFFNEIVCNIELIWKNYTIIFVAIYGIKAYINNRDTKKLNEILKEKKCSKNY